MRNRGIPLLVLLLAGCATASPPGAYKADFANPAVEKTAMDLTTLAKHMDHPQRMEDLRMGMIHSSDINAANAGGQVFYFTDGLMETDDPVLLKGVIAHELAHDDKGHVAQGIAISILVSAVFTVANAYAPGVGQANQIVNPLITRAFSRSQELEADRHGVEILRRYYVAEGMSSEAAHREAIATMSYTLNYLKERYGRSRGGLLATHPGIDDRMNQIAGLSKADTEISAGGGTSTDDGQFSHTAPIVVQELTPALYQAEVATDSSTVFVFVYSKNSRYSRQAQPIVSGLAQQYADRARFYRLDTRRTQEVLGIGDALPSPIILVMKRGIILSHFSIMDVSDEERSAKVETALKPVAGSQ